MSFNAKAIGADPRSHLASLMSASKSELTFLLILWDIPCGSSATRPEMINKVVKHLRTKKIVSSTDLKQLDFENVTGESDDFGEEEAVGEQVTKTPLVNQGNGDSRDPSGIPKLEELHHLLELEHFKAAENEKQRHELLLAHRMETSTSSFDIGRSLKLVPQFCESDPDSYFKLFENTAEHFQWPQSHWLWLIQPKLTGKAAEVFMTLLLVSQDYETIKQGILDAYSVSAEAYRQSFRRLNKATQITYSEFISKKSKLLDQWLAKADVKTFPKLRDLILLEEFHRKVPYNVMIHIMEKQVSDLVKAALLADEYALLHRKNVSETSNKGNVNSFSGSSPETLNGGTSNTVLLIKVAPYSVLTVRKRGILSNSVVTLIVK